MRKALREEAAEVEDEDRFLREEAEASEEEKERKKTKGRGRGRGRGRGVSKDDQPVGRGRASGRGRSKKTHDPAEQGMGDLAETGEGVSKTKEGEAVEREHPCKRSPLVKSLMKRAASKQDVLSEGDQVKSTKRRPRRDPVRKDLDASFQAVQSDHDGNGDQGMTTEGKPKDKEVEEENGGDGKEVPKEVEEGNGGDGEGAPKEVEKGNGGDGEEAPKKRARYSNIGRNVLVLGLAKNTTIYEIYALSKFADSTCMHMHV